MSSVKVITDAEFETEVTQSSQPVLAYFWASWCGPCRLMSPIVDQVAAQYSDRLKIVKLEIDPNPTTVGLYKVEGVPALRFFNEGELTATTEGIMTPVQLEEFISKCLS